MPQTSRRTRRERRIKRQNTLLYRGLVHQTKQLNVANALIQRMVNADQQAPATLDTSGVPQPIEAADTAPIVNTDPARFGSTSGVRWHP